jgi:hypothetical protein
MENQQTSTPETDIEKLRKLAAEAKAKRAAAIAAHEQKVEARKLQTEIELGALETATGLIVGKTLAVSWAPDGRVVACKAPDVLTYEAYRRQVATDQELDPKNMHAIVDPNRVYPSSVEAMAIFTEYPQILELSAVRCANLCCEREEDRRGK